MAGVHFPINSIYSLIKHHIGMNDRYDTSNEAEFSLLFFEYAKGNPKTITSVFKKVLRNSDVIFNVGDDFILMLPYTDWNGALKVLEGLQTFLERKEEDTIVTYPDDSRDARELLMLLKERVEKYYDKTLILTF